MTAGANRLGLVLVVDEIQRVSALRSRDLVLVVAGDAIQEGMCRIAEYSGIDVKGQRASVCESGLEGRVGVAGEAEGVAD
jgi:hypothetical protein